MRFFTQSGQKRSSGRVSLLIRRRAKPTVTLTPSLENPTSARRPRYAPGRRAGRRRSSGGRARPGARRTVRDRARFAEQCRPDPLDANRPGDREAPGDDPQAILRDRVPGGVVGEAVRDVPAQRMAAAEARELVERQRAALYCTNPRAPACRWVDFLRPRRRPDEERRQAERHIPKRRRHDSRVARALPHRSID